MIYDLRLLFHYRTLINFLTLHEKKAELLGTALGVVWQLIGPALNIGLYYFVVVLIFGRNAVSAQHSFVTIALGLIHFGILQGTISITVNSIRARETLLKQVKIEPIVFVGAAFYRSMRESVVPFLLAFGIFALLGPGPSWSCFAYPVLLAGLLLMAWSWSLLAATVQVFMRDTSLLIGHVMKIMMYAAPVVYPVSFVSENWRDLYLCNPVACLHALLQWALLGQPLPHPFALLLLAGFIVGGALLAHWIHYRLKTKITKAF